MGCTLEEDDEDWVVAVASSTAPPPPPRGDGAMETPLLLGKESDANSAPRGRKNFLDDDDDDAPLHDATTAIPTRRTIDMVGIVAVAYPQLKVRIWRGLPTEEY